ncbi:molybdate transport system ATP-binding protein [Desulfocicer vacuolatum DSM 3385]|uniref:Molybdate transport system ATP-binding protein n=1 Tax=Desulfocicer vacuolatum DSM 3385 TaxID=1121400 RepID=A0A1W2AS41_9BACT|nr:ATP-binding cassette domain-containing protein [Desulfocicer vacuolatum]SMC63526.1 molybdate transport system ATP-binding protein [Desulfocicer vacuolatum DSM 3385]
MKIKNLCCAGTNSLVLTIDHYELPPGEPLLVCGRNGSGKSLLAAILAGEKIPDQGTVSLSPRVGFLGFALEDQILEQDRKMDCSEEMEGGIDWGRTAGEIIGQGPNRTAAVNLSGIANLLEKPFKILSTGEIRKVLMARALAADPDVLVLDAPYAGLDIGSREQLTHIINTVIGQGTAVILVDFYHPDLPHAIKNMIYLEKGKIVLKGDRKAVTASRAWQRHNAHDISLPHHLPDCFTYDHLDPEAPFVRAKNISVSFNDIPVFSNLDWTFRPGENWHILGPNGCGKSTLLKLISGDSTKAYGQDLTLFGIKRGSGESIWDIKRHYGIVGAELHRDYRAGATLLGVVVSGFFDTIGLYDTPTATQIDVAKKWIELLKLGEKEQKYFSTLSYGEQRLALIARAVVKLPLILILDEPCQGLDNVNRARVLALIDYISANSNTHILFVSHDPRDHLECLTHQLKVQDFNN